MPDIPLPKPQPPLPTNKITSPPAIPVSPAPAPKPISGSPMPPKPPMPNPSHGSVKPTYFAKPPVKPSPGPLKSALPPTPKPMGGLPTPPKPPMPGGAKPTPVKPEDPSQQSGKQPQKATADSPIKKFLPFIIGGVVLLLIAIGAFTFFNSSSNKSIPANTSVTSDRTTGSDTTTTGGTSGRQTVTDKKTQITYWGLWESNAVLEEVFSDFEALNPGVEIIYQKQSHVDYRQRLQTAVSSGNGPDLFRYHASWVSMISNELAPLPSKIMSTDEYQETFYPVASQQLQVNGQIVGIPLMYDGLALFYNKEVFDAAGEEPPKTWTDLKTLAAKLTVRSGDEIKRSGLAIGNASTTEHFSDIIALLMLQNGADPSDLTSKEAQEALIFYTNFVVKDKVWDDKLPSSTVAFARGDTAMMLAPSWRAHEVQEINPNLSFGIVSTPTLGDKKIAWASYWAEGVSSKSDNKEMAWELLKYLSSKEIMQKLYNEQAKTRAFGEIYSRVDLADTLANDPLVAPYLADAPYAQGWYLSSYTHDKGLNDNLIKYYQDAVNALINEKNIDDVIETLSLGSQQILRQYNIQ